MQIFRNIFFKYFSTNVQNSAIARLSAQSVPPPFGGFSSPFRGRFGRGGGPPHVNIREGNGGFLDIAIYRGVSRCITKRDALHSSPLASSSRDARAPALRQDMTRARSRLLRALVYDGVKPARGFISRFWWRVCDRWPSCQP